MEFPDFIDKMWHLLPNIIGGTGGFKSEVLIFVTFDVIFVHVAVVVSLLISRGDSIENINRWPY